MSHPSLSDALSDAIAGLGGSIFSSIIVHPIDFIKIRMQVPGCQYGGMMEAFASIIGEEGFLTLYTGLQSELIKGSTQNFIYFYVYALLKDIAMQLQNTPSSSSSSLLSSSPPAPAIPSNQPKLSKQSSSSLETPNGNDSDMIRAPSPLSAPIPITSKKKQQLNIFTNLLIGMLAGCVTQLFVNPLSVVQTRIMTEKKIPGKDQLGMFSMVSKIVREEGLSVLFAGIIPAFVLTTNPAIQFLVFDRLKSLCLSLCGIQQPTDKRSPPAVLPAPHTLAVGAIAKIAATLVTYPYIMAKIRLQWKGSGDQANIKYSGAVDVIQSILRNEGFFALYSGLKPQLFKSVLAASLLFLGKEKIIYYGSRLLQTLREQNENKTKKNN